MDVTLPPKLEEFVRNEVRTGRYVDEADVVRDAVRQMRAMVRAAEDPHVSGVVRDAIGIASQAQRDVLAALQHTDRDQSMLGDIVGRATSLANTAVDAVRKVPGAKEVEGLIRGPAEAVAAAAEAGELQARAARQNLEATAKALGVLTGLLERANAAGRTVNSVISPPKSED